MFYLIQYIEISTSVEQSKLQDFIQEIHFFLYFLVIK